MQVLAEGRWLSPAGRIVTDGIGWKPSSDAGRAGEPEVRKGERFILFVPQCCFLKLTVKIPENQGNQEYISLSICSE